MEDADIIFDESERLIHSLVSRCRQDSWGTYWDTFTEYPNGTVLPTPRADIYAGQAGIILLIAEYYRITGASYIRPVVESAYKWLFQWACNNTSSNFSFFTGKTGVATVIMRVGAILGDSSAKSCVLDLTADMRAHINEVKSCEVLGGLGGILMGLLQLHSLSAESSFLDYAEQVVTSIVERAEINSLGVLWDRSPNDRRGLCGFAHGMSGIGFALINAGEYMRDKSIVSFGRSALEYVIAYRNESTSMWPDIRSFRSGLSDSDNSKTQMNPYWCHGLAGVGHAFLVGLDKNSNYGLDYSMMDSACGTMEIEGVDDSICHGTAGIADFIVQFSTVNQDGALLERCRNAFRPRCLKYRTISQWKSGRSNKAIEDDSLFLGKAGIAYVLLRLAQPSTVGSIACPFVSIENPIQSPSEKSFAKMIGKALIAGAFPRSSIYLTALNIEPSITLDYIPSFTRIDAIESFIDDEARHLNEIEQTHLSWWMYIDREAFELDQKASKISGSVIQPLFLDQSQLFSDTLRESTLILNSWVRFYSSTIIEGHPFCVILIPSWQGVYSLYAPLSWFHIATSFVGGGKPNDSLRTIEISPFDDLETVRLLLRWGILQFETVV